MVERVVVNPEGMIIRLELLPPFSYLRHVTKRVQDNGGAAVQGKTNASDEAGACSDYVQSGDSYRTQLEHRTAENTLEFTITISFPQSDKLKRLSAELAFR